VSGGEPILSVRDLSVSFRTDGVWRPAVEALSFDVGPRETVALVGESGSGKSVTALSVMRLLPPANSKAEGIIRLDGRDVLKLPEREMRSLRGAAASMIFQEPMTSLNPVLTVGFQIAEALTNHRSIDRKTAEAEALRILERVRVPAARQRLHDYPHRFSGGMRQRVMIAIALACRPKLLIADEPTTALDVTVQADILELIKSLQDRDGMSVLFITHDMGVVAEIADRVVVMWKGSKVEEGAATEVLTRPQHSYTQALAAREFMRQTRRHVRRQPDLVQEIGHAVARLARPGKTMDDDRLGDGFAGALARIEAGERILKHHLNALANLAQGFGIERADILPLKKHAPFAWFDQPQDRAAGRRFAAARLADEGQRLAGAERERDVLDRMHAARRSAEDS